MGLSTTKKNHIFTVQRKVGRGDKARWVRIVDALFVKRQAARECVRELRNVTKRDYRVRKMVIQEDPITTLMNMDLA